VCGGTRDLPGLQKSAGRRNRLAGRRENSEADHRCPFPREEQFALGSLLPHSPFILRRFVRALCRDEELSSDELDARLRRRCPSPLPPSTLPPPSASAHFTHATPARPRSPACATSAPPPLPLFVLELEVPLEVPRVEITAPVPGVSVKTSMRPLSEPSPRCSGSRMCCDAHDARQAARKSRPRRTHAYAHHQ
jgi:hypothetical protein